MTTATEDALRAALCASFKNRAMLYWHIFDALRRRLGEEQAMAVMKEAIYARGVEIGQHFKRYDPDDLQGLRDAFLAFIPDGGGMFDPEVRRCDAHQLDIKLRRCPLKEAWQEAGLPEAEIAKLCHMAGRADNGTFEAAGFAFSADTWTPGDEGCCFLHIRPGGARGG
jgi:L-2-amino-thiazoline-4-carboxylic acid hydrolase